MNEQESENVLIKGDKYNKIIDSFKKKSFWIKEFSI